MMRRKTIFFTLLLAAYVLVMVTAWQHPHLTDREVFLTFWPHFLIAAGLCVVCVFLVVVEERNKQGRG